MKSKDSFVPRLVVIEGNDKGKVIPLKDGTLVIGRSKGDILIHDPRISRSHVALHYDEKKAKLSFTDLKSLNGVLHNGASCESGDIQDGDKLQLGNTTFDCQIAREGVDATVNATQPSAAIKREPAAVTPVRRTEEIPRRKIKNEPVPELKPVDEEGNWDDLPKGTGNTKWKFANQRTRLIALAGCLAVLLTYWFTRSQAPLDLPTEIRQVRTLSSQGKVTEAVSRAEDLTKQFKETSESFMLLGDMYNQQGNTEQALLSYKKAHELPPSQPLVHLRLIRLFLRSGLTKEAESELKHVDELIRKEGTPSKDFFIETAEIFLEFKDLKQPPEKLFILAKALQNAVAPGNKIGYKLEAQSYLLQRRLPEAIEILNTLLNMDPSDEWTYESIAFAKLTLGDAGGAITAVDQWLKLYPKSTKALLVLAYLKFNDGKPAEAEPLIQKVLELTAGGTGDPHYAESLHLLGQVYLQTDRTEDGTKLLKQACDLKFQQACKDLEKK